MMPHGRSGTEGLGRSGTECSDVREPKWLSKPEKCLPFGSLNLANKESFGFLLTQDGRQIGNHVPTPKDSAGQPSIASGLTHVTLAWQKGRREDWLKFGKPVGSRIIDRTRRIESYSAGQLFGLVCWAANEYGTVHSSFYIVRAVGKGEQIMPVPQVDPGGDLLLSVHGWPKVAQLFRLIDAIETSGIDPCDVAPDHWRHIHNRIAARETPRGYTLERHRAWLQRKALLS